MRRLMTSLMFALTLPLAVHASEAPPQDDPMNEGVTLKWSSLSKLAVTARVALPNGCHKPEDAREMTPQGTAPVANAVAVTLKIDIEPGMCTQEYRVHRFDLTVNAPVGAAGVIVYELRTGEPPKATLYPLPKRMPAPPR